MFVMFFEGSYLTVIINVSYWWDLQMFDSILYFCNCFFFCFGIYNATTKFRIASIINPATFFTNNTATATSINFPIFPERYTIRSILGLFFIFVFVFHFSSTREIRFATYPFFWSISLVTPVPINSWLITWCHTSLPELPMQKRTSLPLVSIQTLPRTINYLPCSIAQTSCHKCNYK